VSHVRVFKHYIPTPFVLLALFELTAMVICFSFVTGVYGDGAVDLYEFTGALGFGLVLVTAMVSMGVYPSYIREGFTGMMLRTAVAFFLIGGIALASAYYLVPALRVDSILLSQAGLASFLVITVVRWGAAGIIDYDSLKRRVVILGTGRQAERIATRLRRRVDQRGFTIHAFLRTDAGEDRITPHGIAVTHSQEPLIEYCKANRIQEIVVALDERRRDDPGGHGAPLDELLDCKLSGIDVTNVIEFFEREVGKIPLDLLSPGWMVFSQGFVHKPFDTRTERILDITAGLILLAVSWPIMLIVALAIVVEDRNFAVLYRQQRVGLNGRIFKVLKFRSMTRRAEPDGRARWAAERETRVTRVGRFIRKSRIDELPQIFNVLAGQMSFVGPRPERPEFVDTLADQIPFYSERHRVKPGITGWAQLCYPYGASVADAREKLEFDLYYLKNHSVMLDLMILIQTVEIVLIGEGAR